MSGIGSQKISYKDSKEVQFDNLDTYLLLAKKSISKFANKVCAGLSIKMLKDEDAISSVANSIMMADWRWDENYINKAGTKKSKYSYRNQCAIWSIQTYASNMYKKPKNISKVYSLDYLSDNEESYSIYECIEAKQYDNPINNLIKKEEDLNLKTIIEKILQLDCLSDRQKDYIKLYYFEGYTFEKIGKKYNITREAVRQGLSKAINMLKELSSENV